MSNLILKKLNIKNLTVQNSTIFMNSFNNLLFVSLKKSKNIKNLSYIFRCYSDSIEDESINKKERIELNNSKILGFTQKNNPVYLYFEIDFSFENFLQQISEFIKIEKRYAILFKLSDTKGFEKTAGKHIAFYISSDDSLINIYKHIYDKAIREIKIVVAEYNFISGMDIVKLILIELNTPLELNSTKISNIKDWNFNKSLIPSKDIKRNFSDTYLPLSMNKNLFGYQLKVEYEGNSVKIIKYNNFYIYNSLQKDKIWSNLIYDERDGKITSYIYKKYLLIVKDINVSKSSLDRIIEVYNYDENTTLNLLGKPKLVVYDNSLDNNGRFFRRSIGNDILYISDNKLIKYEKRGVLPPIASKLDRKFKTTRNTNIGVLDTETYFNEDEDISYVYAIGFKILNGEEKLIYIKENQTSEELVIECLKYLLISRYNNYIFYVHNLSGFDVIFILKALIEYNSINGLYFILEPIFRDNKIIKLNIKIKSNKKYIKISLYDSYLMLPFSLESLAVSFNCKYNKTVFPYKFVSKSNLNYIGLTPNKDLFNNISKEEYNIIYKNNWSLKDETLKYLLNDLRVTMEVIDKFNEYIFETYGINFTKSLTISRLALEILFKKFLSKYLQISSINSSDLKNKQIESNHLPMININTIYDFISQSYYGGLTEVYIPYGENLKYYDVNSEYPFVSKNKIPSNVYTYVETMKDINGNVILPLNLEELFGFFYCKVKTNNGYIGLLPRHIDGSLVMANGEFYGTWFSEELKFAKENGYEIEVIKGYNFVPLEGIFDNFVDTLYDIRISTTNSLVKTITKLILNSVFGRFGMSIYKPTTKIVNNSERDLILATHENVNFKTIAHNVNIISYEQGVSREKCEKSNLNYLEVIKKYGSKNSKETAQFVSISTASAITSYARIHINKIKLWILNNKGKIFYSDTDSIVTDIELPENLVGNKLGQLKKEYDVKKAYFISNKTYILVFNDDNYIVKAKGVSAHKLSLFDFETMYYDHKDLFVEKGDTKLDYIKGTVNIKTKTAILRHDAYTKREKIFNSNGLWIDTKALILNNYEQATSTESNSNKTEDNCENTVILDDE
jgi:hypothetical protein